MHLHWVTHEEVPGVAMSRIPRRIARAVVAPSALVLILGAAAYSGGGCATTGHTTPDLGESPATADAGSGGAVAPGPLNTSIISNTSLCAAGTPAVDWSPLRRISRVEYDNMVRDLLGDTTQPATTFVPESPMAPGVNFDTNTYTSVSTLILQQYQQAAETLAQAAVDDTNRLNNDILPCQTQDDACAQQFIAAFANRAFRGQLDATESAGLFQVYSSVKAQFDFATGIQAVITAVLESPRFLYVLEFGHGTPNGQRRHPVAVRGRRAVSRSASGDRCPTTR